MELDRSRRPRQLCAVGVCLLLVGCAPGGGGRASSPAPAADASAVLGPRLSADEALAEANQSAAAERDLAALITASPGAAAPRAAHALLLARRGSSGAAVAEARTATRLDPGEGEAWAALCRTLDWSGAPVEAVAAGRRAVALSAGDASAHLVLAEALADSGHPGASRGEIEAARRLLGTGGPVGGRAELLREESNLARDSGDRPAELRAADAAYQLQPGWAARAVDLAGAYLDAQDLVGAANALKEATRLDPADLVSLRTLARVSLLAADLGTAGVAADRLVAALPDDPGALEIAALIAVAGRHDPLGASRLLTRSLALAPGDAAAASSLGALGDRLGLAPDAISRLLADAAAASGDDRHPRVGVPHPIDLRAIGDEHAARALAVVNRARVAAGLPAVTLDLRLSASAAAHCYYWLFDSASPSLAGLRIHRETVGDAGFTGTTSDDRAEAQGWHDGPVGEDITHRGDAAAAVSDWLDSVYHRAPILRPDLSAVGYADCALGPLPMEDLELGFGARDGALRDPVESPPAGAAGVVADFVDNELPDPVPVGRLRDVGSPVTVSFDPREGAQLSSFTLSDSAGAAVDVYVITPSTATENMAALVPQRPLQPGATYAAHLRGFVGTRQVTLDWAFTIAG